MSLPKTKLFPAGSSVPAGSGSLSVPTWALPPEVKQSYSCQPERSTGAVVVLVICRYSSNCEAAVLVRNWEITTPDGEASAAGTASSEAKRTTRTADRRRRMQFLLSGWAVPTFLPRGEREVTHL